MILAERVKGEQKQAYIGNRLYELCMMQVPKDVALPYESFSATFDDKPKDTRTAEEIREEIANAFL